MDKIICIGKNYIEHAQELGDAVPEYPVVFLKPPSVSFAVDQRLELSHVHLSSRRGKIHYECEVILKLSRDGEIQAVSLGLDLTLRELQADLKKKGLPWEAAKVFSSSAVIGPWIPIREFPNYLDEEFQFSLNGTLRQKAKGKEMRFSPDQCIHFTSSLFPIMDGDVLFTGTPAGVGAIEDGQIAQLKWGDRLCYRLQFHLS
ncbi:FAA hydrolase family protein [bacterium]|nr:FAA hydrolase family protein [bacterium]